MALLNRAFLEAVVGKGYRFIGPVRVIDARYPQSDFGPDPTGGVSPEKAGAWSERSSLAVLPLMLLGNTMGDHGICLGLPTLIQVLAPPLPTRLLFLLAATVRLPTSLLPLLESRMGIKPTTTKRTLPPREHSFSSNQPQKEKQTGRARKEKSKREKLLRFDLRKKESEGWKNHATSEDNPSPEYWPVKHL